MKNPEESQEAPDRARTVQIAVAVLGVVGVVGAAFIGNWDKFFNKIPDKSIQTTPPVVKPNIGQSTAGAQSPAISQVTGDVTVNIGTPATTQTPEAKVPQKKPLNVTGIWTARLVCCPGFIPELVDNFVFDLETDDDGEIEGTALAWDGSTRPVLKGRIRDNRIYFETLWKNRPGTMGTTRYVADDTTVFRGKVSGRTIAFTMILDGGTTVSFTATKQR